MHPLLRGVLIGLLIEVAAVVFIMTCAAVLERQEVRKHTVNQEIMHHANA